MRNVPWFEPVDPDAFFPRCYRLSHDEEKGAFIGQQHLLPCCWSQTIFRFIEEFVFCIVASFVSLLNFCHDMHVCRWLSVDNVHEHTEDCSADVRGRTSKYAQNRNFPCKWRWLSLHSNFLTTHNLQCLVGRDTIQRTQILLDSMLVLADKKLEIKESESSTTATTTTTTETGSDSSDGEGIFHVSSFRNRKHFLAPFLSKTGRLFGDFPQQFGPHKHNPPTANLAVHVENWWTHKAGKNVNQCTCFLSLAKSTEPIPFKALDFAMDEVKSYLKFRHHDDLDSDENVSVSSYHQNTSWQKTSFWNQHLTPRRKQDITYPTKLRAFSPELKYK